MFWAQQARKVPKQPSDVRILLVLYRFSVRGTVPVMRKGVHDKIIDILSWPRQTQTNTILSGFCAHWVAKMAFDSTRKRKSATSGCLARRPSRNYTAYLNQRRFLKVQLQLHVLLENSHTAFRQWHPAWMARSTGLLVVQS